MAFPFANVHKRVYCKLNAPVKVGRRTYDLVALDYVDCCPDTGRPETMAFPAKVAKDGSYEVASWGDLMTWYDAVPDFERYCEEIGAVMVTGIEDMD